MPSFFLTTTTFEENRLWLCLIASAANISFRCSLTSWNKAGGILLCGSLNGVSSLKLISCLTRSQFPKSVTPVEKTFFHLRRNVSSFSVCSGVKSAPSNVIPGGSSSVLSSSFLHYLLIDVHCFFLRCNKVDILQHFNLMQFTQIRLWIHGKYFG